MSTKKLAKELGLLRQRSKSSTGQKTTLLSNQTFSYLIVIDFESTCWREKNNHTQEIIEFPAVLLNTSTGKIELEFHTYVQPQERPILSAFCTELTGITQTQVEAGVPLRICLSQFGRWLQKLRLEKGVVFSTQQQSSSSESDGQKLCTFLTWSDWDLGVCLHFECKRKQIHKPNVLNSWIDLRSTYRMFYSRKPKGLNGALQDLGIQFSGREHSGLDDARNTAQLATRMMKDGCVMKITRSLDRIPLAVKPTMPNISKLSAHKSVKHQTVQNQTTSSGNNNTCLKRENRDLVQNLLSPKTVLDARATPRWGIQNNSNGLILCSTVLGDIRPSTSNSESVEDFSVEDEDRITYDDVILEDSDGMLLSVPEAPNVNKSKAPHVFKPKCFFIQERTTTPNATISHPASAIPSVRTQSGSVLSLLTNNGKMTPPLCNCGRRAKRLQVSNGGPNHGKGFYCCAGHRSGGGSGVGAHNNKGCQFFKWESSLKTRWSLSSTHDRAKPSAQRSTLRKSW
ncbi:ERI1 exoribonuclease 2 [Corythoichthys intestinalis]|uniref:ERI1 exoribonuclease 2 n=1 Tax=Corythoichthys intestinalis TaxID=161448 RepID=UPI0025A50300|nr:ERI1 exoribonuclease 2 [Corythoichthys intestinalis]XP_061791451.1 ERI1 exoribonuclease 2-like [Nerophis lumbriciformis]